jgi:hypothetical protein
MSDHEIKHFSVSIGRSKGYVPTISRSYIFAVSIATKIYKFLGVL